MHKNVSLLAAMLMLSLASLAQNGTIKGFVYNKSSGEPMIYTNVLFSGTRFGVQTDINGYFSITLPAGPYSLYVTATGYDTTLATVNLLPGNIVTEKLFVTSKSNELKGVEVSARKTQDITHVNVGKTTITPADIKLLPSTGGEPDVIQYLQVVPGVVFGGDQGGQLFIRGGSPSQTGVYLDGVTIYNPVHSLGIFSVFETEAIKTADVYTAAFNAEYGNRTGAILDVHTIDGNKNEVEGLVSVSPIMARAMIDGPLVKSKKKNGSGITFLLNGKSSYLNETSKTFYSSLGEPFSSGLPYSFNDYYGKVTFNADNGSKLNLFAFSFDDRTTLLNDSSYAAEADYHWHATGAGGTFVVSPSGSSTLIDGKFSYSKYNVGLTELEDPTDTFPRSSEIDGFEGAINFTYFLPHYSELKYGFEVDGLHTSLSYESSISTTTALDEESTMAGLYVDYRKDINDKLIIEPSFRAQYYSELSKLSPEPRLGIKYNISRNVRLKLSSGVYSQNLLSTKDDIDIVNFFTGFTLSPEEQINNTKNQPVANNLQTAYHVAGGIEVDVNKVTLNLEPWYKDFPQIDELNRNKMTATDPDFVAASEKAYGIDLSGKYSHRGVYLYTSVGFQDVTITNFGPDGSLQTYPSPYDTRINANVVGSYNFGKRNDWQVSTRFNMHSPFPFTQTQGFYENQPLISGAAFNPIQNNGPLSVIYSSEINDGRLSYYHRLDLSARKRFTLSNRSNIEATASITNVYDRENIFYIDRITNGRVYQLPLFPSINLTWHF